MRSFNTFVAVIVGFSLGGGASAQSVLFDFNSATTGTPLPMNLTVGGVTANFSATGQGFSVQQANTMGFTPVGFSGNCLYPGSVFASDLRVTFSQPLTSFSILYAPQELACDSSATMKVSAYTNGTFVGSNTAVADPPGTWPTAILAYNSGPTGSTFNEVVVHYQSPPPTGGDWGPIFMADNMTVTPVPEPGIVLTVTVGSLGFLQRIRRRKRVTARSHGCRP